MNIFNFAHDGVHHATEAETVTHESNSTLWIVAVSVVMAVVLYVVVRRLSHRQPQEASKDEQDS